MEALNVRNLSFCYPNAKNNTLQDISFTIEQGAFVTLCGISGSGKTTLLQHLKPDLTPAGTQTGEVLFFGQDIKALSQRERSSKIGFVMQSPDNQIVTDKVWHELAFGLESLGYDSNTIRRRVAETADFFGISRYFESDVTTLSGGQKQLLNLASVMATQPELLILDEPTGQLDPIAAADFLACVARINRELSTTVIITEHRLEDILPISSKVIVIENGCLIADTTPKNIGVELKKKDSRFFSSLPTPMRVWHEVDKNMKASCPVTVTQGREWLKEYIDTHSAHELYPEPEHRYKDIAVELKNICFRYQKNSPDILKGLNLTAHRGELVSIMGSNGAGKSTLLSVISGIETPYSGKVKQCGKCLMLPQNPQMILTGKTVRACLSEVLEDSGYSKSEIEAHVDKIAVMFELSQLMDRHPFDLSGGEQQKAALAIILLLQPDVILLDEPTKGLDANSKTVFADTLQTLILSGVCVIMVSHDIEFCAQYAHTCMLLFNGEIITCDTPRKFFSSNSFYVTSANRMSRGLLDEAVTAEDVIYCCTGKRQVKQPTKKFPDFTNNKTASEIKQTKKTPLYKRFLALGGLALLILGTLCNTDIIPLPSGTPFWIRLALIAIPVAMLAAAVCSLSNDESFVQKRKPSKRTITAAVMILLLIPITIFVGTVYLNDQKYLFISLLVLIESMLPFFLIFEGRKPQARELVIIAVMCAIAIAGRSAFIMLPQVKPVVALIIIAGTALGSESGFIVGAVTMLVSNIYFGQGAWTPWQMFAAGIIGFISGFIFRKGLFNCNRAVISVYGFVVTIVVYGGIMNFGSLVLTRVPINNASLAAFYAQGLPMDIIHALSTMVILWFAAEPMLNKLQHAKTKYSILV